MKNIEFDADPRQTDENSISILEILTLLAKHKKFLIAIPIAAGALTAAITLLQPNVYTASTRILPPQQSQASASALLGQLGPLAGAAGGALGIKNPNGLYVGMLKSRTVADRLVEQFKLNDAYDTRSREGARRALEKNTAIADGKDGLITVSVTDTDPKRAAEMASAYVQELTRLTKVLAVTEASRRRLFFETELKKVKDSLTTAEITLKRGLDRHGIINADVQGAAMVEAVAKLRAHISAKEIQISAMRAFAAENNPDLRLAQQELGGMKRELAEQEGRAPRLDQEPSMGNDANQKGLETLRTLRDVKYYETLYEFLAKQFEAARIDEAKDATLIQVLDPAQEPERKSGPNRAKIVIGMMAAAAILAIVAVFARAALTKVRSNPRHASQLEDLSNHLRLWGK